MKWNEINSKWYIKHPILNSNQKNRNPLEESEWNIHLNNRTIHTWRTCIDQICYRKFFEFRWIRKRFCDCFMYYQVFFSFSFLTECIVNNLLLIKRCISLLCHSGNFWWIETKNNNMNTAATYRVVNAIKTAIDLRFLIKDVRIWLMHHAIVHDHLSWKPGQML